MPFVVKAGIVAEPMGAKRTPAQAWMQIAGRAVMRSEVKDDAVAGEHRCARNSVVTFLQIPSRRVRSGVAPYGLAGEEIDGSVVNFESVRARDEAQRSLRWHLVQRHP